MALDMTQGPMDDAGYPLLSWRIYDWHHGGEVDAHGWARRYNGTGRNGLGSHWLLSPIEKKRIKDRENLGLLVNDDY